CFGEGAGCDWAISARRGLQCGARHHLVGSHQHAVGRHVETPHATHAALSGETAGPRQAHNYRSERISRRPVRGGHPGGNSPSIATRNLRVAYKSGMCYCKGNPEVAYMTTTMTETMPDTDRIEKKVVLRAPRSRVWRAIS